MKGQSLLLTDSNVVPVGVALSAIKDFEPLGEDDMLVITQAFRLRQLPIQSASLSVIVLALRSPELPGGEWFEDIVRVWKPGGTIIGQTLLPPTDHRGQPSSTLECKLLLSGFLEVQALDMKSVLQLEGVQFLTIKTKASWIVGSSYLLKRTPKTLPKIQIDDESDLIDEDSLLTEEDLKKPE